MVELVTANLLIKELTECLRGLDSIGADAAAAHVSMAIDLLKRDANLPD